MRIEDARELRSCPICKGTGQLEPPGKQNKGAVINNTVMAKLLRKEGYSLRQIAKFLGYNSPQSVVLCLARIETSDAASSAE